MTAVDGDLRPSAAAASAAGAAPFLVSLPLPALAALGAWQGGWAIALAPFYAWVISSMVDKLLGLNLMALDPATRDRALFWHRAVTWIWAPLQLATTYGSLWAATRGGWLSPGEGALLMASVGVVSGVVGITYAHELIHQSDRAERWLGDILLGSVLYGHFRTEHLFCHHIHVGTARDPISAPAGMGFWRFLARALPGCLISAWEIERDRLARKGKPVWAPSNPFWRYGALAASALGAGALIGGWMGAALIVLQAFVAVLQLEAVNYVEHYGLRRRLRSDGTPERVQPHHSWNASHSFTNWLMINLQRHSDHHCHPGRRYPLLAAHGKEEAPQLPYGYPIMAAIAFWPPIWRRVMDKRVRAWRARFYPGVGAEEFA